MKIDCAKPWCENILSQDEVTLMTRRPDDRSTVVLQLGTWNATSALEQSVTLHLFAAGANGGNALSSNP